MGVFVPFSYQKSCLRILRKHREAKHSHALVVMAMGLGKTVVSALDILQFTNGGKCKVLYLAHQHEILEQAQQTFSEVLGATWTTGYLHGRRKDLDVDVLFASFQTMQNWRNRFNAEYFDYIVIDESHHSLAETYLPTVKYFKPQFGLAITGTPDREDLQDIREIFGKEIVNLSLEKALARNYLTPVDYRIMTDNVTDAAILERPAGKLSIAQLNRELFRPRKNEEIARIIQEKMREVKNPKVVVFCQTIAHAEVMARLLEDAEAYHSGQDSKTQRLIFISFRRKTTGIITTIDKFNEGVDVPGANVIVFLRGTGSKRIFFQQLGRGLRKVKGKKKVIILDFVGNIRRLEMLDHLVKRVKHEKDLISQRRGYQKVGDTTHESDFEVGTGLVVFDEKAIDILSVLKKVKGGYTKEELIIALVRLSIELGRVPSGNDVDNASIIGKIASNDTYCRYFGSITQAQVAAGLQPNTGKGRKYSDQELLAHLKKMYEDSKKVPTRKTVDESSRKNKTPNSSTYRDRFGTLGKALVKAGIRKKTRKVATKQWSRQELLNGLQILVNNLGRVPSMKEVKEANRNRICGSPGTYWKYFGGVREALDIILLNKSQVSQSSISPEGIEMNLKEDK